MSDNKLHLVCPQCHAVNRASADRLDQEPVCGTCKAKLFPQKPLNLDAAGFDKLIARSDVPVLVDFWAPWCGPCRMMAPAFEEAARQLHPRVLLAKVDTQQEQSVAAKLGIRSIPTLAIFKKGKEITRVSGAMDARKLVDWTRQHVG